MIELEDDNEFEVLVQELRKCCLFDFTSDSTNDSKKIKLKFLKDLASCLSKKKKMTKEVFAEIINFFIQNIFGKYVGSMQSNPADENRLKPAIQPYLKLIYHLFLESLSKINQPLQEEFYIDKIFVLELLKKFDKSCRSERGDITAVLYSIYEKFLPLRSIMRKEMYNIFNNFIVDNIYHNGIPELLKIFRSFATGFTLPLKVEHRDNFLTSILPLYCKEKLYEYDITLSKILIIFVQKDFTLTDEVIKGLLDFWSENERLKQDSLLYCIHQLFYTIQPQLLTNNVILQMYSVFSKSLSCERYPEVFIRIVFLLTKRYFLVCLSNEAKTIFQLIFPKMYDGLKIIWTESRSKIIHCLIFDAMMMLKNVDKILFKNFVPERNEEYCQEKFFDNLAISVLECTEFKHEIDGLESWEKEEYAVEYLIQEWESSIQTDKKKEKKGSAISMFALRKALRSIFK